MRDDHDTHLDNNDGDYPDGEGHLEGLVGDL